MTRHIRLLALAVMLSSVAATAVASMDAASNASAVTMPSQMRSTSHPHPPHATGHRHRPDRYGVSPAMMQAAQRVSNCEEGGNWHFVGAVFDGGIGWTLQNWAQFRKPSWPRLMHDASPYMQANALFRFVRHYGISLPDQAGSCYGY